MAYRFRHSDRSAAEGVRRIASERLEASLALLGGAEPPDEKALHSLRKGVKMLRGLIGLVGPVLAGQEEEDRPLRDAGRAISGLRDRDVMLAQFDALADRAQVVASVRAALRDRIAAGFAPATRDPVEALATHRAALTAVRARVPDWRFDGKGYDILAPGLERGMDRARKALKHWRKTREAADLHRLRKAVKAHGYHARLLTPIWPAMMAPHAALTDDLGETLGEARDRSLLAGLLDQTTGGEALATLARNEARTLERDAEKLARKLLAEPGEALAARWGRWWRLWRG